jgi:predicted TIM-barrel fold metal-dependent hydrolase
MSDLKLFSVDDHIIEHRDVWTSRLPSKYQDQAPRVVEEDGNEVWLFEDQRNATLGLNAVAGQPKENWNTEPRRFEDMIPACYDPVERSKLFREQGVVGSVLIPTLPGFGGRVFSAFKDKELANLCVRAYNDFVIEEWCAADPGLYVPTTIVQLWDPKLAATEVRRNADRGGRSIVLVESTEALDLPSLGDPQWYPLWDALQETETVISCHGGSGGNVPGYVNPDSHFAAGIITGLPRLGMGVLMEWILSDRLRDFPGLKMVLTEQGVGWVPYLLERADHEWETHGGWWDFPHRPSDIFRQNFWVCLVNERFAVENRHAVGIDRIVWEWDFPHAECTYPFTQKYAAETFAGVPQEDVDKMTHLNAAGVFRWAV